MAKSKKLVKKQKTALPAPTPGGMAAAAKSKAKQQKKYPAFMLAQVDPFAAEVMGCKIPDRNTMPSVTNRFRGVYTATTDSNGNYACGFRPYAFAAQWAAVPVAAGPSITWGNGTPVNLTCASTMGSQYADVRTVAYGIRMKYVGPRTTSGGKIHIACVGSNLSSDGIGFTYWPRTPAEFENSPWYANYSLNEITEQEIVVPGRRIDEGSFRYRSPQYVPYGGSSTPSGAIETSDGWGHIVVFIEGATASASVVQIEVVYHFEALVNPQGGSLIAPSPAAPPNTAVLDASMNVSSRQPVSRYVEDGFETIKKVISTITYGASQAKHLIEMGGGAVEAIAALL